jgi:phage pi2 protein 07
MTIYYPITQEELSEYAKLKAESISADMASMKSVEEKAKKIEEGIIRRIFELYEDENVVSRKDGWIVYTPDGSRLFKSEIKNTCGYRDELNVCTCQEMLCYLTSCPHKDMNECPVHNESVEE